MAQQLLAAPKVQLKAKMTQKSATRPEEVILDAVPGGSSAVGKPPRLSDAEFNGLDTSARAAAFQVAVESTARAGEVEPPTYRALGIEHSGPLTPHRTKPKTPPNTTALTRVIYYCR